MELLQPGDVVLSFDLSVGRIVPRCILRVRRAVATELIVVRVGDEELRCTPSHPFYSTNRQEWVPAEALLVGEHVARLAPTGDVCGVPISAVSGQLAHGLGMRPSFALVSNVRRVRRRTRAAPRNAGIEAPRGGALPVQAHPREEGLAIYKVEGSPLPCFRGRSIRMRPVRRSDAGSRRGEGILGNAAGPGLSSDLTVGPGPVSCSAARHTVNR